MTVFLQLARALRKEVATQEEVKDGAEELEHSIQYGDTATIVDCDNRYRATLHVKHQRIHNTNNKAEKNYQKLIKKGKILIFLRLFSSMVIFLGQATCTISDEDEENNSGAVSLVFNNEFQIHFIEQACQHPGRELRAPYSVIYGHKRCRIPPYFAVLHGPVLRSCLSVSYTVVYVGKRTVTFSVIDRFGP